MVSSAAACRSIEIEHNFVAGLFEHLVKKLPEILLTTFGGDGKSVDLEHPYAVFFPESRYRSGIFLPVREIVLHTRIEP